MTALRPSSLLTLACLALGCSTRAAAGPVDAAFDAGPEPVDAVPSVDVNRPDAPRPIGPVVTGRDLTPADYACLGMLPTPPTGGTPIPVAVEVRDFTDHGTRAGYGIRSFAHPITSDACSGDPTCREGMTDTSGVARLDLAPKSAWLSIFGASTGDDARTPAAQWLWRVPVAPDATSITVEAVSIRFATALSILTGGNPVALGHVRDCQGQGVQRARVRAFDETTNTELTSSFVGTSPIVYGSGTGAPATGDRTAIDALYAVSGVSITGSVRLEAWGRFAIGGDDVLLGCEVVSAPGVAAVVELGPLASDAPPTCGSVP